MGAKKLGVLFEVYFFGFDLFIYGRRYFFWRIAQTKRFKRIF